jgi:hypothetical protein
MGSRLSLVGGTAGAFLAWMLFDAKSISTTVGADVHQLAFDIAVSGVLDCRSSTSRDRKSAYASTPRSILLASSTGCGQTMVSRAVCIHRLGLVGLLGFEPRTKGFTLPKRFRPAWTISSPSNGLTNHPVGCGTL